MIQLAASLLLSFASASTGDHAALHPQDASLYLELPDVQRALTAYHQAPLVRLATDAEVAAVVRDLAYLPEDFDLLGGILEQAQSALGPEGMAMAQALLAIGGEVRALSLSVGGLTRAPSSRMSAAELAADPSAILDTLELLLVLEFEAADAPHGLLAMASEALRAQPPGEGPETVELMGEAREVHYFSSPKGVDIPNFWMLSADRLLVLGCGTATPAELSARAAGGASLLTREDVLGTERFTSPAGATVYQSSWYLPTTPVLADLLQDQVPEFAVGIASALLGSCIPLEPQISHTRVQLRDGRFVKESIQRHLAPAGETWRRSLGQKPLDPAMLGRVNPQALWVWVTSVSREGWGDLAQLLVESLLGTAEDVRAEGDEEVGHGAPGALPAQVAAALDPILDQVLGSIGENLAVYMLPIAGPKLPQIHAVLELEDSAAFEAGITRLAHLIAEQADGMVSVDTRPYRRSPVITIKPDLSILDLPDLVSTFVSLDLTFGIVGQRAIVGLSAMDVKREMRGLLAGETGAHPLAQKGAVPEGATAVSSMDWAGLVGGIYDTARTLLALAPDMGMIPVNTADLPESKLFTRFFRPSRSHSIADEQGTYRFSESSFGPEVLLGGLALAGLGAGFSSSPEFAFEFEESFELSPSDASAPLPAQREPTRQALQEVKLGLVLYRSDRGKLPRDLGALLESSEAFPSGYLRSDSVPRDGWGHALRYERTDDGQGFQLWSVGPNGEDEQGAGDDIVAP